MKKFIVAMTVALLTTAGAIAQDEKSSERKQPTKSEMIQHHTERMAQRYSLTDEQKAKLTELNTKYADLMARPRGGEHGRHPQGMKPGKRERIEKDSVLNKDKQKNFHREFRKGDFEKMRAKMDAYNSELKGILTEEQFSAYENDRKKMMHRR